MSDYCKAITLHCVCGGGIEIRDARGNGSWVDSAAVEWRADHKECPKLFAARRPDMPTLRSELAQCPKCGVEQFDFMLYGGAHAPTRCGQCQYKGERADFYPKTLPPTAALAGTAAGGDTTTKT